MSTTRIILPDCPVGTRFTGEYIEGGVKIEMIPLDVTEVFIEGSENPVVTYDSRFESRMGISALDS